MNEPVSAESAVVAAVPNDANVHVKVGDEEGDFDEHIAPLVAEMWKAGIETTMLCHECCCGHVNIEFRSFDDLTTFIDILVGSTKGPDLLRDHIVGENCEPSDYWTYDLCPTHYDDDFEEDVTICIWPSVQFSHRDMPCVLRRLQWHNAGAGDVDVS